MPLPANAGSLEITVSPSGSISSLRMMISMGSMSSSSSYISVPKDVWAIMKPSFSALTA